jgi:hypothetical protein
MRQASKGAVAPIKVFTQLKATMCFATDALGTWHIF